MPSISTHHATLGSHRVELEFDQTLRVLNRARLRVDGEELDATRVFYGEKDLTATLDDGAEIAIRLHSGMVGELTRAQLRGEDGTWTDLVQ